MTRSSKFSILAAAAISALAATQARATFNYDLRFAPGSEGATANLKTVDLSAPGAGGTYTLQLWAQVTANTILTDDVVGGGWVTLVSNQGSNGGALTAGGITASGYNLDQFGASNKAGVAANITADGVADWGSTNTASTANSQWFHWYSVATNTAPAVPGYLLGTPVPGKSEPVAGTNNAWEVLVGTFTVDASHIASAGANSLTTSFVVNGIPAGIKTSLSATDTGVNWYEDGSTTKLTNGTVGTGATFMLPGAPIETPEPASLGVLALGGLALLAKRRRRA